MTTTTTARTRPAAPAAELQPAPDWVTLCIYAHLGTRGHDALVRDVVMPLAEEAVASGEARGWFFLRYWHGGPHVRLRLRDPGPQVLDRIERRVGAWLREDSGQQVPTVTQEEFRDQFGVPDPHPWREHAELVREPYLPETDRYGGPEALVHCERFFQTSSRVAGAALHLGDRAKVFALGLDLMVLAVRELKPDALEAARSARRYFLSWDFVTETRPDRSGALRHAEALQHDFARSWVRREQALAEAVRRDPGSTHAVWQHGVRQLLDRLRELEADGRLTRPPEAVLWSVVHMMNNRLGISVHEERVLAWLTARVCTGWWVEDDYFDDGASTADRSYLEHSKYALPQAGAAQQPRFGALRTTPPRPEDAERPEVVPVPLPPPAPLDMPLEEVLVRRGSDYGDYGGRLTLADLATVLARGAGSNEHRSVTTPFGTFPRRTYPSPGSLYPTSVLVNVWAVDDLDAGLYLYQSERHVLLPVGPPVPRSVLAAASPSLVEDPQRVDPANSIDATTVPVVLLLVSDLGVLRPKYGLRALRLLLQESGHLAQNLVLAATAVHGRSVPVSAFSDDDLSTAVHLDGLDRFVSTVIPLGTARTTG